MKNRINELFTRKPGNILSVYFTAGYPRLEDTTTIIELLEKQGVDLVEIGIPFSDPTADGPVIQKSSDTALKNGMSLELLFRQLEKIRERVTLPLLLMGYVNTVLQFGVERFCRKCRETGIDGLIFPDLPAEEYEVHFKPFMEENHLHNIFLITPQTSDERIRKTDSISSGFIYMVSSSSTTGAGKKKEDFSVEYFTRVQALGLRNPRLIGFGISDKPTFENACRYAQGAIIGSAFVKALAQPQPLEQIVREFTSRIRD